GRIALGGCRPRTGTRKNEKSHDDAGKSREPTQSSRSRDSARALTGERWRRVPSARRRRPAGGGHGSWQPRLSGGDASDLPGHDQESSTTSATLGRGALERALRAMSRDQVVIGEQNSGRHLTPPFTSR